MKEQSVRFRKFEMEPKGDQAQDLLLHSKSHLLTWKDRDVGSVCSYLSRNHGAAPEYAGIIESIVHLAGDLWLDSLKPWAFVTQTQMAETYF